MNITEIREQKQSIFPAVTSNKDALLDWFADEQQFGSKYGLTLMPKKVFYKYVPASCGVKLNMVMRHLTKEELIAANERFFETLNKLVYKNAYKRHGKKLVTVLTIEGEKSFKDLHTHAAIAAPTNINTIQFAKCVRRALALNNEFLIKNSSYNKFVDDADKKYRYKLDIVNNGWLKYITKELDKRDLQNLYFP